METERVERVAWQQRGRVPGIRGVCVCGDIVLAQYYSIYIFSSFLSKKEGAWGRGVCKNVLGGQSAKQLHVWHDTQVHGLKHTGRMSEEKGNERLGEAGKSECVYCARFR